MTDRDAEVDSATGGQQGTCSRRSLAGLRTGSFIPRLLLLVATLVVAVVALVPTPASAHSGKQSYLYVSIFDDGVQGRVEIPVVDLGPVLDVELWDGSTGSVDDVRTAVVAAGAEITEYVADNVSLADTSGSWSLEFGDVRLLPTSKGPYAVVPYEVTDTFDSAPRSFTATFDAIIEADPDKDALLLIEDDWRSATFDNGSGHLLGFSTGATVQEVVLDDAATLSSMGEIRGLGSDSVRNGIDTMLLVAALAASIVLVPAGRSRNDVATPRELGGRVRRTSIPFVGAFAIGAFVSGVIVEPPTRPLALLMAAALAAVAIYAAMSRYRPEIRSAAPLLAAGAGMAAGLELGRWFVFYDLDRSRPIIGWVAFVVGALIALALVALFAGVPSYLVRRTRFATPVLLVMAVVFVGYAVGWAGEAVFDADWSMDEIANPLRVWPRNAWLVLLAIAAAAGVRAVEARAGRLRAVGPTGEGSGVEAPSDDVVAVG